MKLKYIIGIVITVLVISFLYFLNAGTGGYANILLPIGASVSTAIDVGPDQDIQILATSSSRTYVSLMTAGEGGAVVYCEANSDIAATSGEGVAIASTTALLYEWTSDKGNLFSGALRCTSTATSTMFVQQFLNR